MSGICHLPEEERAEVVTAAYSLTAYTNALNPDAYPGVRKMEAEVVRMTAGLFHGGPEVSGTMTSGGTESLLLAVLAYRGAAAAERGVTRPNLVMPDTAHVALDKAGHYFGVAVRKVAVDPATMTPRMRDVRRAVDANTIMLVASAPQYPHGILDPVEDIAGLGRWSCSLQTFHLSNFTVPNFQFSTFLYSIFQFTSFQLSMFQEELNVSVCL